MFNKETEYAIRGLVYIQLQNLKQRRPGTTEIAREIDAPPFYTAKILQRLVRAGFLESLKGKGGGFFFKPGIEDLPLRKLISATEGEKAFSGCGFGLKQCSMDNPCPLHERYASIRDAMNKMISEETVQSLARKLFESESVKLTQPLQGSDY